MARARDAIRSLRTQGATAYVALVHAGMEHTDYPDPADVALLHEIAGAGFDVVAASHSHRLSGYSRWSDGQRSAFCFQGLGSVASGVVYSEHERSGLLVVLGVNAAGRPATVEARPIELDERGWGRIPGSAGARRLEGLFYGVSRHIETGKYRDRFYQDMANDLIGVQVADFVAAFRAKGVLGVVRKLRRLRMKHIRRLTHKLLGSGAEKPKRLQPRDPTARQNEEP